MTAPSGGRAAQYLRMSTDHQRYSLELQSIANAAYASEHKLEVVKTYSDAGVSGMQLVGREGLKSLLSDILSAQHDFDVVLVYDVSRWGRFQDPDQAAHYEFMCREAGVQIAYTAEPYVNDEGMIATLAKQLKRAMASEYSRDLSTRVTASMRGLSLKGYWPGGNPGLGLRRCVVAPGGKEERPLQAGEQNAIKGWRVVISRGPASEVALVRHVFRLHNRGTLSPNRIARILNSEKRHDNRGKAWTQLSVRRVLANELYVGTRVLGKREIHMGKSIRKPPETWVRVVNAAEAIISPRVFREAQRQLVKRRQWTDNEMLEGLKARLTKEGRLSEGVINRDAGTPCPCAYRRRFGSMTGAYAQVGYTPTQEQKDFTAQLNGARPFRQSQSILSDSEVIARLIATREREGHLSLELIALTPGLPRIRTLRRRFGSTARIYELCGHVPTKFQRCGIDRWSARVRTAADL